MPEIITVYWRDIPASVQVKKGRKRVSQPLPERFEQAIDRAAMKSGAADTDDYLAEWRKGDPVTVEGEDLDALAKAEVEKLEAEYDKDRLMVLINNGGNASA